MMKLAVSNIAWNAEDEETVLSVLRAGGVSEIEVAPTKIWPEWRGASRESAAAHAASLAAQGFGIPALQSVLFGRNELSVFGDEATRLKLVEHLAFVAEIAMGFGAGVLVFGSPRSRDPGTLDKARAHAIALEVFREAGARCAALGTCLCIEPNPKIYMCSFLTSWREAAAFVQEIDHPGIGLHLDTACISMEGDNVVEAIRACAGHIAHFHISEPNLADFSAPLLDHEAYGAALRATNYQGCVSIEMRASETPTQSVRRAISYTSQWYAS